jgi:hypothetical protein
MLLHHTHVDFNPSNIDHELYHQTDDAREACDWITRMLISTPATVGWKSILE